MCVARGLPYNCQCEWNFLEGVLKWEVRPDTAIPGITTNTGNLNILAYLHQLGQTAGVPIELDPHSHEGGGYTYADVAHLLYQCGVTPAPVVGGHILDDATWVSLRFRPVERAHRRGGHQVWGRAQLVPNAADGRRHGEPRQRPARLRFLATRFRHQLFHPCHQRSAGRHRLVAE